MSEEVRVYRWEPRSGWPGLASSGVQQKYLITLVNRRLDVHLREDGTVEAFSYDEEDFGGADPDEGLDPRWNKIWP